MTGRRTASLAVLLVCLLQLQHGLSAEATEGPRLEADGWVLDAGIECGNAEQLERIGESHFALAPREDPIPVEVQKTGPISNYVVNLAVTNKQPRARVITLDVRIPAWLLTEGFDYFLRKPYWQRSPDKLDWRLVEPRNQVGHQELVRLQLILEPLEQRIVSTVASYPFSHMRRKLESLERLSKGKARIVEIGRSALGRPMLALETGDPQKPRAVFAATMQPGEPSAWAILAMAEAALLDPSLAEFQQQYDLSFVPMPNPDGIVMGANNVNGKGEIALIGFQDAAAGQPAPVESRFLWKYLARKPPKHLIDFHFLESPNHSLPTVYIFDPELFSDPERRGMATTQARRLEDLSGVRRRDPIKRSHPLWKGLVTFNSIVEWNTLANLYQYTGPATSHLGAQTRGVEVLRTVLDPGFGK